jgi:hypothetical protein
VLRKSEGARRTQNLPSTSKNRQTPGFSNWLLGQRHRSRSPFISLLHLHFLFGVAACRTASGRLPRVGRLVRARVCWYVWICSLRALYLALFNFFPPFGILEALCLEIWPAPFRGWGICGDAIRIWQQQG